MAITEKQIIPGSLITDSVTTVFTAPADKKTVITSWDLAHDYGSDITVELWVVPALDSPTDANRRLPGVTVPSGLPMRFRTEEILDEDHTIQVKASVTNQVALSSPGYERS